MFTNKKFIFWRFSPATKTLVWGLIFLLLLTPLIVRATGVEETREALRLRLEEIEKQIEGYRAGILEKQKEATSLEREISILKQQIKKIELEIERIDLAIEEIELEISEVQEKIAEVEAQMEHKKTILASLLREIYEYDEQSLLEVVLAKEELSEWFSEIQSLYSLQKEIQEALSEIGVLREKLEREKKILEEKQREQLHLKTLQEFERLSLKKKETYKNELLSKTQGQERRFQELIKKSYEDIDSIRNQLYFLRGLEDTSLRFEDAVRYAEFASAYTGVRPAFLLAILSRESDLGRNLGSGYWKTDMSPGQQPYFLAVCQKLRLDPDAMPVSKRAWYGWGGAMGIAQFLPRTWLGYESRVATITGHNPPSPWDFTDAFVAAGLYLANAGASKGTYDAEWKAAMIYLAGSNWSKPYLSFYGDQVMDLAASIQEQIDLIK